MIKKLFLSLFLLMSISFLSNAQYCFPTYNNGCTSNDYIDNFSTTGGVLNITNNASGCNGAVPNNYIFNSTMSVSQVQGFSFNFSVQAGSTFSQGFRIWIDWNQDLDFADVGEDVYVSPTFATTSFNGTIIVPINALVGPTRMRVLCEYNNVPGVNDYCGTSFSFGECEDYVIEVLPAPPCSGNPIAGTSTPVTTSLCAGQTLNLSTTGGSIQGNMSYQWQQSINGGVTWANAIGGIGATTPYYQTPSLTSSIMYRVYYTCLSSGLSDTSSISTINVSGPTYASLPYTEDFEIWATYCSTNDVPKVGAALNFSNNPSTGDASWRREDDGATANWISPWFGYSPTSTTGLHSAAFHSSNTSGNGDLDLYIDCSQQLGGKSMFFDFINDNTNGGTDSLEVLFSSNGGTTFTSLATFGNAVTWQNKYVPINSNSATTIVRFRGKGDFGSWSFGSDLGIDNVNIVLPCTGTPTAGTAIPAIATLCAGQSLMISTISSTLQGNLAYQWQQSNDGGSTWINATGGSGANSMAFQTPSLSDTVLFRVIYTCLGNGLSDTSDISTIEVVSPSYASLPFSEDFEVWGTYCGTNDVPKVGALINWINSPSLGNESWRRDDDGATAGWFNSLGAYSPASTTGVHSARFHSFNTNLIGNLDLYLDCSQQIGNKILLFDYKNFDGFDELEVLLSTNGGNTYNSLSVNQLSSNWQNVSLNIASNSPNTIIRFKAIGDFGNSDIGLDNVNVIEPCVGAPIAGVIDSIVVCPNIAFNLQLSGNFLAGGLSYVWESAPTATGPWTVLATTTTPVTSTSIATATYFRCTVTCLTSGLTDITPAFLMNLGSFYYCYCNSQATTLSVGQNIGNVTIKDITNNILLDNGVATPLLSNTSALNYYTNFTNLIPTGIFKDSTYNLSITAFSQYAIWNWINGFAKVYIDYNRDGSYDPVNELAVSGSLNSPNNTLQGNFTVPSNVQFGITGMRVVYQAGSGVTLSSISPCGQYLNGETEDYLVNINLPPCTSTPYAGIAYIDDAVTCPGYSVFLTDTTHDLLFANLTHNWQVSTDGTNYVDVPGATFDTMTYVVNSNTWFRFRTTCNGTSTDTSNTVTVTMSPPFACYGNSQATGGSLDISDIGAFIIADVSTNNNIYSYITGGPHLSNPLATRKRTDNTYFGAMDLYTDSTYKMSVYHVKRNSVHTDAKVTMFIDYNNNQQYDIPAERVYSGIADINNFYLNAQIHTIANPALGVGTGMRIILNDNLGNNPASDNGFGTYTSGETEDYLVKFKLKPNTTTGVDYVNSIQEIGVFPNPATNKVFVGFKTTENTNATISILSLTGAVLSENEYKNINGNFVTELELGNFAKGTYFIQINSSKGKYVRKLIVE